MAWPKNTKASTANVDAGTDLISNARGDIKQNIDNVNDIIDTFDIGGDSAGQIADGDILQYSSSANAFQPTGSDGIGGSNQMLIPFTGWVVNNWSGVTTGFRAGDSANAKHSFDRMALLGGAYYRRNSQHSGDLDLTASEGTVFNSISGASVTTATPSLVKPTGYSTTGTNVNISITNGVASNSLSVFATLNGGGSNDKIDSILGGTVNVMYGEGYESYITLPAGNYFLKMFGRYDAEYTDSVNHIRQTPGTVSVLEQQCEDFIQSVSETDSDVFIYNKTDDTFITDPIFDPNNQGYVTNTFTELDQITTGSQGQRFTLTGTKQIMIWTPANKTFNNTPFGDATSPDTNHDFLGFRLAQSTTMSGDSTGTGTNYAFSKSNVGIPARYGWVTRVPNTWISITKY